MAFQIKLPGIQTTKTEDLNLISKIKKTSTKKTTSSGGSLIDKITSIKAEVVKHLGQYKDIIDVIWTTDKLNEYIDAVVQNNIVAIDTETTGLDPIEDTVIGFSLYTPGQKAVYIPVNHTSYVTLQPIANQPSIEDLTVCFQRLLNVRCVYHNAKFDIRMIKNQFGVKLNAYWDTMLGAKLMDESDSVALKYQYGKIFEDKTKKEYDFDSLFGGIDFRVMPVEYAAYYAAMDPYKTYKLYEYQKEWFDREENAGPKNVFFNIEMPVLPCVIDMEEYGVCIDKDFARQLSEKYHQRATEVERKVYDAIDTYKQKIEQYKILNPNHKLSDPISVKSPQQLAVLLYDIIGIKPPDKDNPRGTGEEILSKIDIPLCKYILEYRGIIKLISTYIDAIPQQVSLKTGRLHCTFKQYGADTGRFSSEKPNAQNIPVRGEAKEIRKMFVSSPGYTFVGGDFSQQEPRLLAHFSGDDHMIDAYVHNRDLYAVVASKIYNTTYENCLEHNPDGSVNPEGKQRRKSTKSVLLGLMYGRGASSIAEQMGISTKEAQGVIDSFYESFPKVKKWMVKTEEDAKHTGYVCTVWGRRRHVKDMMLEPYTFEVVGGRPDNFTPFFEDVAVEDESTDLIESFKREISRCKGWKEILNVKQKALSQGIKIHDNGGYISQAQRQCVNSRIQGSAADMSKIAMRDIYNDPELIQLGYHMQIVVHDEIIGECPVENSEKVKARLCELMIAASAKVINVPMKCDPEVDTAWSW